MVGNDLMDILARIRAWIIRAVTVINVISTVTSTAESYMGLRAWAAGHGMVGFGAGIFPGFIDAFPLAAEGVLIIAYIDHWRGRARVLMWLVLTGGLAVSVGLNVGHIHTTDMWTLVTNGVPPVATWLSLLVGTAMFKRIMANRPVPDVVPDVVPEPEPVVDDTEYVSVSASGPDLQAAAAAFADDLSTGRVPGLNRIRTALGVGHTKAPVIQAYLRELATQRAAA